MDITSINEEYIDNEKEDKLLIVKKAIKGNKECYGRLIKENSSYIYKMAYLYVKNEEEALEIVQEAVYRGFLGIKKLKKPEFFRTWLTRIIINASADYIKKKRNIINIDDTSTIVCSKSFNEVNEKIDLYSAIDLLKENYKTVIIMKYFYDMKIKNIAEVLEIPESTIKTYISRAKMELKNILKEDYLNE